MIEEKAGEGGEVDAAEPAAEGAGRPVFQQLRAVFVEALPGFLARQSCGGGGSVLSVRQV